MDGSIAVFAGNDARAVRSRFAAAAVAASAVVMLSLGRAIFVPLSLAAIAAFALAPVIDALRGLKFSRGAAVAVTVLATTAAAAAVSLFLGAQFADLAGTPHATLPGAAREPAPAWIAASLAEPLLNPMASAGIAVLFASVLLLRKDALAGRFAHFAEAGQAFSRRLLSQGLLDLGFGIAVAFGLWCLDVPGFGLWALLGTVLRSVPFVGVTVAALCPLMLTASPPAFRVCETLILFLSADGALHLIARDRLKRDTARLTAFAAIAATAIWTCLWGLTGLLLAMPLTLGLVLLGRCVPQFAFLGRLLAGASEAKAEPGGDTALQALAAAERALPAEALPLWSPAPSWRDEAVLCIAGPGSMDEAAAGLLAEALKRQGLTSRVIGFEAALPASLPGLDLRGVRAVCIACLYTSDAPALRRMVRRLRPRLRGAHLLAGLWGWDGAALMDAGSAECDLVTTRLPEAADQILRLARAADFALAAAAA